ncbi:hypothetical protein KY318_02815 [Candidatus Woesearchaeota archaeon]|mgnify:CR=1 FL=1|nr:hypothetical protein [Candidatus Woesearchaeota archaeon]
MKKIQTRVKDAELLRRFLLMKDTLNLKKKDYYSFRHLGGDTNVGSV